MIGAFPSAYKDLYPSKKDLSDFPDNVVQKLPETEEDLDEFKELFEYLQSQHTGSISGEDLIGDSGGEQ